MDIYERLTATFRDVFDDADLDAAVQGAMLSKFRNAGQTCVCANRILVQDAVYDEFTERLMRAAADFTLGNGMDDGVTMGPLINEKAANDVIDFIEDAVAKGATAQTDPEAWSIVNGKLYLNFSPAVKKRWSKDIPGNIRAAESNWPGVLQ